MNDKPVIIYLCGPIENVSLEEGTGWRNRVKQAFKEKDYIKVIDPFDLNIYDANCEYPIEQGIRVVEDDKSAILSADILIVNSDGRGCGTWMEMLFAWEQNKLLYGFGSNTNPWYKYHITQEFASLDDIIKHVSLIR